MSISIRRARIEDRTAIEHFIRRAYQELAPFKGPDRWCWQFVENPFLPDGHGFVPVWIALDCEEIVGQIAAQATDVQVNGKVYSAGWIVDVMIRARLSWPWARAFAARSRSARFAITPHSDYGTCNPPHG